MDSELPLVAILVLNWNGLNDTLACLDSLKQLEYPNSRVMVIDNGSTDGSPDEIQRRYPDMLVMRLAENVGFAAGLNPGIALAVDSGADQVMILNNDTIVASTALGFLVSTLKEHPSAGVSVPKITYYESPDLIWSAGAKWTRLPPRVKIIGFRRNDGLRYSVPKDLDYATGCAFLVSREAIESVGLLDEAYFMYQEDYDYFRRVREQGYTVRYEPRAVVRHKVSQGLGENSPRKWYLWSKSLVRFYRRYATVFELAVFALWVLVRESLRGNFRALPRFFQGLRDGLRSSEQN